MRTERQESFAIQCVENAAAPKPCRHVLIHRKETFVIQRAISADAQQPVQLVMEIITALWDLALVISFQRNTLA